MGSFTLHIRNIKKLPGGGYSVQVELINSHPDEQATPASESILESVTLSARVKGVERLENPQFVEDGIQEWFASRRGKWDKVNIQKYLEFILQEKR